MNRVVSFAAIAILLAAGVASARSVITTLAGCQSEFGRGGAAKACEACVKAKGRYAQHASKKGQWACE
jgi:hypothetical protein